MSSMNTITNWSKYGLNTQFIKSINNAGALVYPKDMTKNSKWPYLVLKIVFETSSDRTNNW